MIDIHCHILPGIDDGPATLDEAVAMCRIASGDGIETIVATPHFKPGKFECSGEDVGRAVSLLNGELMRQGVKVSILPGADVSVTPELPVHLDQIRALTINGTGRYFLAELPHETIPAHWDQFLLSLQGRGFVPILTHPERNRWFLNHPDALYPFVLAGGLVQLTAMSITGGIGDDIREYCRFLLRRNLVHVIATDAHSPDQRPPILSEAVRAATAIIGQAAADRLVRVNPQEILTGRHVDAPEPVMNVPEKRRWYQRILDL
jgi:protein-tyrosine phosphatase